MGIIMITQFVIFTCFLVILKPFLTLLLEDPKKQCDFFTTLPGMAKTILSPFFIDPFPHHYHN